MSQITVKEEAAKEGDSDASEFWESLGSDDEGQNETEEAGGKTCVETCRPGPRSGCTTRGKGKPAGNLSCAEVDRRIEALGVNAKKASLCVKAAIMKGLIKIKGENKEELQ